MPIRSPARYRPTFLTMDFPSAAAAAAAANGTRQPTPVVIPEQRENRR